MIGGVQKLLIILTQFWVACEQSHMMLKMLGCLWLGACYYVFIPLLKQLLTVAVILHFTCQNY